MDMTPIAVDYGPTPWPVQAFRVFLIVYPLIFASRRLGEFRRKVPIAASIIPEIFLSSFVGAAIAWLLCIHAAQG